MKIGNFDLAKEYGKKSFACAEKINDEVWQLNATVLIAQSEVKLGDIDNLNNAIGNFEKAFRMTENKVKIYFDIIIQILDIKSKL